MIADSNVQRNKSNNGRSNSDRLSHAIGNCILFVRTIFDYSVILLLLCVCFLYACLTILLRILESRLETRTTFFMAVLTDGEKKLLSCYLTAAAAALLEVVHLKTLLLWLLRDAAI